VIKRPEDPQQMFFVSRAELVAEEPLVRIVGQVVNRLDLEVRYGRYSEGVRSSREIAKRIKYDIRYQYFVGDLRPDFRTINRFRQENLDLLGIYFARIVAMCEESGLVDVSVFGNLKSNLGFTRFKLRSLAKVRGEFLLMCIAHNLKKLATYGSLLRPVQTAALKAVHTALTRLLRLYQYLQDELRVDFGHFNANHQPTV